MSNNILKDFMNDSVKEWTLNRVEEDFNHLLNKMRIEEPNYDGDVNLISAKVFNKHGSIEDETETAILKTIIEDESMEEAWRYIATAKLNFKDGKCVHIVFNDLFTLVDIISYFRNSIAGDIPDFIKLIGLAEFYNFEVENK